MMTILDDEPRIVVDPAEPLASEMRDPYGTPGYGLAAAAAAHGTWLTVVADGWRLPLVLSGPPEALEAASPYGYGGLRIDDRVDAARANALWARTCSLLAERGVVSLFVRFPPFAPAQVELAGRLPGLDVRRAGVTVLLPTIDEGDMWLGMASSARRQVRKAQRLGLTADVMQFDPERGTALRDFRRLYDATMDRLDAPPHLRFDDDHYRMLADGLGDRLLVTTVRDGADAVASCLVLDDGALLHYHLAGSTPEGASRGANNLMIWTTMGAARTWGRSGLHLGGGRRDGDSLLRFKTTFGGELLPFHVGRAVIDAPRYGALVDLRAQELGTSRDALEASGYFPAFRAEPPDRQAP